MNEIYEYNSNSKINLFLDITGRLKNGYHAIESVFTEISLSDKITVKKNDLSILRFYDIKNILPAKNLLTSAGELFLKTINNKIPFGIDFIIEKNIPIGGGIGGGSGNAASVLKILNQVWSVGYGKKRLKKIGSFIGADVSFFIEGGIQKVWGIGEKSKKITTKNKIGCKVLLIFPEISVLTKDAYKLIDEHKLYYKSKFYKKKFISLIKGLEENNYTQIISNIYNVFEEVIFIKYPEIKKVYELILNCNADKVFMTGSGSTLVAFFYDDVVLDNAQIILKKNGYKTTLVSMII